MPGAEQPWVSTSRHARASILSLGRAATSPRHSATGTDAPHNAAHRQQHLLRPLWGPATAVRCSSTRYNHRPLLRPENEQMMPNPVTPAAAPLWGEPRWATIRTSRSSSRLRGYVCARMVWKSVAEVEQPIGPFSCKAFYSIFRPAAEEFSSRRMWCSPAPCVPVRKLKVVAPPLIAHERP